MAPMYIYKCIDHNKYPKVIVLPQCRFLFGQKIDLILIDVITVILS